MHNLKSNFDKIFDLCKHIFSGYELFDDNFEKYKNKPKMSDIEIVALSLTAESLSIDSENWLFSKLKKDYSNEFPFLIDRSNFNRRRKRLNGYIHQVCQNTADLIEGKSKSFIIDSIPLPVCKNPRINRSKICKDNLEVPPSRSYHASHKKYYYGFKLQLITTNSGIPFSVALTTASMHDVKYLECLKDIQISDCELIGDAGYLSKNQQLNLFNSHKIQLITPSRSNMKTVNIDWTPKKRKQRKRIETLFSQLSDQMLLKRNYSKTLSGLLTRVVTKVAAVAVLQFINFENKKQLNKIKHALAA